MSDTDVERPAGETGARCPWCNQPLTIRPFEGLGYPPPNRWAFLCANEQCPDNTFYDSYEAALAALAALAAAARPLPDFPAGAPGPWKESGHYSIVDANGITISFAQQAGYTRPDRTEVRDFILSRVNAPARPAAVSDLGCVVRMPDAEEKRDIFNRAQESGEDYLPQIILETLRWIARSPDACASHVTRPAAAGLRLSDEQMRECVHIGLRSFPGSAGYWPAAESGLLAAVSHALLILSSRATGAEVEILEPSGEEIRSYLGMLGPEYGGLIGAINDGTIDTFRKALKYARRHATIRETK